MKPRVKFSTTTFDEVRTGPGIYARYLWQAFRDDPDIDFHVVAPRFSERHLRLHALDAVPPPRTVYHEVGALTLAQTVGREQERIVRGNIAPRDVRLRRLRRPVGRPGERLRGRDPLAARDGNDPAERPAADRRARLTSPGEEDPSSGDARHLQLRQHAAAGVGGLPCRVARGRDDPQSGRWVALQSPG